MTNSLSDLGSLIEKELLYNYGTAYKELLKCAPQLEGGTLNELDIISAQTKYALEDEMAVTLSDVLLRRTDIGSGEPPSAEIVHDCATLETQLAQRWSGNSKSINYLRLFSNGNA